MINVYLSCDLFCVKFLVFCFLLCLQTTRCPTRALPGYRHSFEVVIRIEGGEIVVGVVTDTRTPWDFANVQPPKTNAWTLKKGPWKRKNIYKPSILAFDMFDVSFLGYENPNF